MTGRIAWGDPATALVLSQHYLTHAAVVDAGVWPEHLYARVATEGALINALRVEPELGTPARGACRARRRASP